VCSFTSVFKAFFTLALFVKVTYHFKCTKMYLFMGMLIIMTGCITVLLVQLTVYNIQVDS